MNHVTSIGLDVHTRSITACAFNPLTGEVVFEKFDYSPAEVAQWILGFESPKAVYESGITGFDLAKQLINLGVDCIVGAVSKMQRSSKQTHQKNDINDAEFLARLLSMHNVVSVMIPDDECEAMRDLVRAYDDIRQDLMSARHRLRTYLTRHGYIFNEKTSTGKLKKYWTGEHWRWINKINFEYSTANDVLEFYMFQVRHLQDEKKYLSDMICRHATEDRWKYRVDALRCLKGIETITAFALVVEAGTFSRFENARSYSAWLGLNPSEYSSGEYTCHGSLSKTGNTLCRRLFIEAGWHYVRATKTKKRTDDLSIPKSIENKAAKATKRLVTRRKYLADRGKAPNVVNCAIARELAGWVWAIGCMAEEGDRAQ